MNPHLQALARSLESHMDNQTSTRRYVTDWLGIAAEAIADPGSLADLDTDDIQQLAGAAHWFLLEGERDEAEAAQAFFRALADAATLARNARLDKFVKYGEVRRG